MKVAIYARYSSARQHKSSADDQIRRCTECAESKGWTVLTDYIERDEETSGRTTQNRNGLMRLIQAAKMKPRPFDGIMIDNTSRFGRSIPDVLSQKAVLDYHGVFIFFVNTQLDTRSPTSRLALTFSAYQDEVYSVNLGDQVSRGKQGRILRGMVPGGRCFGYRHQRVEDPTKVGLHGSPFIEGAREVIDDVEAPVVLHIFELRAEGLSYKKVAEQLNGEGCARPHPRADCPDPTWTADNVRTIVHNEKYRGVVVFHRSAQVFNPEKNRYVSKPLPQSEWKRHINEDLRIVPDELWEKAQLQDQIAKQNNALQKLGGLYRTKASQEYLFSGLVRCGLCGKPIVIAGNGPLGPRYGCYGRRRGSGCSNKLGIYRSDLEDQLVDKFTGELLSSERIECLTSELYEKLQSSIESRLQQIAKTQSDLPKLKKELSKIQTELENLASVMASMGMGTSPTLINRFTQCEIRKEALLKQIDTAEVPVPKVTLEEVQAFVTARISSLKDILLGDRPAAKRALQRCLTPMTLTPDTNGGRSAYLVQGGFLLHSEVMQQDSFQLIQQHYMQLEIPMFTFRIVPGALRQKKRSGPEKWIDYTSHPRCDGAEAVRLRDSGLTYSEIADKFGVSKRIVGRVLQAMRPDAPVIKVVRKRVNYQDYPGVPRSQVVTLHTAGNSFAEIARQLGVSKQLVFLIYHAQAS